MEFLFLLLFFIFVYYANKTNASPNLDSIVK